MPGAKSCSQGWTQDCGVTRDPCYLVTVVAVWIELLIADGSLGATPSCLPPALTVASTQFGDVVGFE